MRREWQYEGLPIELPGRRQMTSDNSALSKPETLLGNTTWASQPITMSKSDSEPSVGIVSGVPQLQNINQNSQQATLRVRGLVTIMLPINSVLLQGKASGAPRLKYLSVPNNLTAKTQQKTSKTRGFLDNHASIVLNRSDALLGNNVRAPGLQYLPVKTYKMTEQRTSEARNFIDTRSSVIDNSESTQGSPSRAPRIQFLTVPSHRTETKIDRERDVNSYSSNGNKDKLRRKKGNRDHKYIVTANLPIENSSRRPVSTYEPSSQESHEREWHLLLRTNGHKEIIIPCYPVQPEIGKFSSNKRGIFNRAFEEVSNRNEALLEKGLYQDKATKELSRTERAVVLTLPSLL